MTPRAHLSTQVTDENSRSPGSAPDSVADSVGASLGVLSVHLEGERCRVGCEYCYLGARVDGAAPPPDLGRLAELLDRLTYDELAVAVSEPALAALPALAVLREASARRGRPLAVTTTMNVAAAHPELLDGVQRVNLSVDPRKGPVRPEAIGALAKGLHARSPIDIVLIVSLVTPQFATRLIDDGLLAALVDLPDVDKVALNGLKPPPPWCDRAFWLRALDRLRPLLARALDQRLFLDCYVAARILGIGGCPARADLSPATGGWAFRSCVYQPALELISDDAKALAEHLRDFVPPAVCPFPIT
jgi:hypothetical protein